MSSTKFQTAKRLTVHLPKNSNSPETGDNFFYCKLTIFFKTFKRSLYNVILNDVYAIEDNPFNYEG